MAEAQRADLYRLLMQAPTLVCIQRGPNLVYEFANPAYQRLVEGREILGKPMREALPELEGQGVFEQLEHVFATGEPFVAEEYPAKLDRHGDGILEQRYFRYIVQPLRDDRQRVTGVAHFGVEITDQVRARQRAEALAAQLQASEARYRTLFESMDEGFCVLELIFDERQRPVDYRYVETNPAFEQQTGMKNALGRTIRELVPAIEPFWFDIYGKVALTGEPTRFEDHAASMGRWFDVYAFRLCAPTRRHVGVLFKDVTERKQAEAALRESEAQFRTLADSMPQLAWIAEADGSIHWYNRRWYEYTGTTSEQMNAEDGWGWRRVHDPAELPRVEAHFRTAVASGKPWEDTFPLRRHDGEFRSHLSRAMPVRDALGRIVRWFGTNTDVEDSRRQARELRDAVEARDTFLSVASHELKTPLTPLALRLTQLKRDAQGTSSGHQVRTSALRHVEIAEGQVRKLSVLVDGLLDVSRLATGRLSLQYDDVDVREVVHEVVEAMRPAAERACSALDVHADVPARGRFDRVRVNQILTNLVSNAIKFGAGKPIHVSVKVVDKHLLLSVRDGGIGMSAQALQRIFNKFERAVSDRNYGGLGLGLWLTRQMVEAMGGTVKAEGAPGEGAVFTVELPLGEMPRNVPA